ncbi:putative ribonuclease H-like domain-containing protein, partial [Tanacetum coccineum]
EISLSVFDVRSSDEENTPVNDSFSKVDGFHVVPPPITGNFLTPRVDILFEGLDEYAIRKKIIESKTIDVNTKTSETVDDEDNVFEVQTVSPVKTNETQTVKTRVDEIGQTSQKQGIGFKKIKAYFVCKSTDHLIKDCNFHNKQSQEPKLKTVVNTGPRGNPEILLQDHAVVDGGCSSHMTGNKAYLSDYEDYNGGFVAFGNDPKGGTEFKNHAMNEFCAKKGIKREFIVARTAQQNGVAERKKQDLFELLELYKGPTQEYILLPLQPHRTRIPVEDVAPASHEKPSKISPKDNDV